MTAPVDERDAGPPQAPVDTRARRLPSYAVAAIVLLALALVSGAVAGAYLVRPHRPGEASAEAGFARDMQTHHAQAVEMSMIAYQRASLPEVRQLGYDIALTQQAENGVMLTWLTQWGVSATADGPPMAWMPDGARTLSPDGRVPGMATRADIDRLAALPGRDADVLYCQLMIRHHLGGLHMVDAVPAATDRREVLDLAKR